MKVDRFVDDLMMILFVLASLYAVYFAIVERMAGPAGA